jgi:putative ABC transport system permease protein
MTGVLRQTAVVSAWSLRTLADRWVGATVAIAGFFAVVLVFVAMLSIRQGFAAVMHDSGSPDVAYVSGHRSPLTRTELTVIEQAPGVERGAHGAQVAGVYNVTAQIPMPGKGMLGSVTMRGLPASIAGIWPQFRLVAGRMFEPGVDEIVVGRQAERLFPGLKIGDTLDWNRHHWKVVGIFALRGSIHESELFADVEQLQQAYNAVGSYHEALVRLRSPAAYPAFKHWVEHNPQLNVSSQRADRVWRQQMGGLDGVIAVIGGVLTLLMSIGAIFGAINIMYANVAERMRHIATLRAVGFGRASVLAAVLLEGMMLGWVGGASAAILAYCIFNGYQASTVANGAMMAFSFAVTPGLILAALVLALIMGLVGGLFPAIHAARMPVAQALREA